MFKHVPQEEHGAVACRFSAHLRTTELKPFAGQYTNKAVGYAFVLAKHETNFSAANTDVTCGDVGILTNMAIKFGHEGLAKPHDFVVAFALGVEVGPAFATAHGKACQAVFESLLVAKKLQDA